MNAAPIYNNALAMDGPIIELFESWMTSDGGALCMRSDIRVEQKAQAVAAWFKRLGPSAR